MGVGEVANKLSLAQNEMRNMVWSFKRICGCLGRTEHRERGQLVVSPRPWCVGPSLSKNLLFGWSRETSAYLESSAQNVSVIPEKLSFFGLWWRIWRLMFTCPVKRELAGEIGLFLPVLLLPIL